MSTLGNFCVLLPLRPWSRVTFSHAAGLGIDPVYF